MGIPKGLGVSGWKDSKLASRIPFEDWWESQKEVFSGDHSKVIIREGAIPVGTMVLVPGIDAQVGHSLLVYHQFLLHEYRGIPGLWRMAMRRAERACIERGLKWLVWTNRDEASGRIYYKYKEVQNGWNR